MMLARGVEDAMLEDRKRSGTRQFAFRDRSIHVRGGGGIFIGPFGGTRVEVEGNESAVGNGPGGDRLEVYSMESGRSSSLR